MSSTSGVPEKKTLVGLVTIGQSPRHDITQDMVDPRVPIVEAGALDGLGLQSITAIAPSADDEVLVTRLRDGSTAYVAHRHIIPLMQQRVDQLLKEGADILALACTGEFPDLRCPVPLLQPQKFLSNFVSAIDGELRIGVMVPDPDQIGDAYKRWSKVVERSKLHIGAASPYGSIEAVEQASLSLAEEGADILVMDCIGYSRAMRDVVRAKVGIRVVLARSVLWQAILELA